MQIFDELFGGGGFLSSSGVDFHELMKETPSPMSSGPVSRTNLNSGNGGASSVNLLLTSPSTNSPKTPYHKDIYLKTKEQILETINKTGLSSFVVNAPGGSTSPTQCDTDPNPSPRKSTSKDAPMVMCRGSSFPKTEKSDKNIEVLSAWRTITSNPKFKVRFFIHDSRHRITDD